ncbi:DUF4129 domain-containing protein [Halorhabdus tiamatea]|nr:DUF4129 domain-containing protein [Halorhabdus tiamatea]
MQVDRRTVGIIVVGVLGVLGLVLSAATLTDPVGEDVDGEWADPGIGEDPAGEIFSGSLDLPIPPLYLDVLWTVLAVGSLVLLLGSLALLDTDELVRILLLLAVSAIFFVGQVWLLDGAGGGRLFDFAGNLSVGNETVPSLSTGESASPGGGGVSPYLLGAGALVVVVTAGLLYARSGDEAAIDTPGEGPDGNAGEARLSAIGQAAGRAADALDTTDVGASNAVYEAWVEMTEPLDVTDPDTTTAGEFADVAIAAGMAPGDVEELTQIFEDVRYGDAPVSPERAERARAALRHIEATYAGEDR